MNRIRTAAVLVVATLVAVLCAGFFGKKDKKTDTVRLGYFPNITHAQAVVGVARGDFAKELGKDVKLEPMTFNAGPSVIEAIYAGNLDISYVGPSPTINGYLRSKGEEVRVLAGSAANGVLIVGNKKRNYTKLEQLRGKKIASPQYGNTQDISAKDFVVEELKTKLKEHGGDTEVVPVSNPDIEILFQKDQLDAAWVPEPWGSRLVHNGLANIIAEERELWPNKSFVLTNIIVRREFLEKNPELVKKILRAHVKITRELQGGTDVVGDLINKELKRLTGKDLPASVLAGSFKHTQFTTDPDAASFKRFFEMGKHLNLVKGDALETDKLFQLDLLKQVEAELGAANQSETTTQTSTARSAP